MSVVRINSANRFGVPALRHGFFSVDVIFYKERGRGSLSLAVLLARMLGTE